MKRYIGEVYYVVEETLNSLRRKKLFCTDENGNRWYRYDKPTRSYEVKKYELVGKLEKTLSGDFDRTYVVDDTDLETEYFLKTSDGSIEQWYESDFNFSVCFISESNAALKRDQLERAESENDTKECEEVTNVKIISRP